MKTIMRNLFIAAGLFFAVNVSAQEAAPAAKVSDFHVGDTIVIKKDHERYLTGEKMSKWVYNVEHTIQQVRGKRFPEGILIRGIYSWVGPDDILNKSTHPQEAEANQEAKRQAEEDAKRAAEEEEARRAAAKKAHQDSIQAAQEEAARQDSIAKEEAARQDSIATAAAAATAAETARQDSIAQAAEKQQKDSIRQAERDSLLQAFYNKQEDPAYVITRELKPNSECDRFTIGLRGGVASLLQDMDQTFKDGKWNVGFDVMLDLQYAHYWKKFGKKMQYGLIVGVGAGFARSHVSGAVNDQFRINTSEGPIEYTVTSDKVKEYDGQIQVEVPLMFSMIHENGFFLNLGPRFTLPVYDVYNQSINKPEINAMLYPEEVPVKNELVTGVVKDDQAESTGKWNASKLNIMLGAEIGYEFTFKNHNSLGIGVYGNYSLYSLYKKNDQSSSIIDITEAPSSGKNAVVTVIPATDAYGKGVGYFDVGLKLAYHFNWWKEVIK